MCWGLLWHWGLYFSCHHLLQARSCPKCSFWIFSWGSTVSSNWLPSIFLGKSYSPQQEGSSPTGTIFHPWLSAWWKWRSRTWCLSGWLWWVSERCMPGNTFSSFPWGSIACRCDRNGGSSSDKQGRWVCCCREDRWAMPIFFWSRSDPAARRRFFWLCGWRIGVFIMRRCYCRWTIRCRFTIGGSSFEVLKSIV